MTDRDRLYQMTALDCLRVLERRQATAEDVVHSILERISETDSHLNAYARVTADLALGSARAADNAQARPALGGLPISIKDNICTQGVRTSCGSRVLKTWVPPYEATAVTRLRQAGAGLLGKTNLDEFAMGSSGENSAWGPTRNPHRLDRVPGGSSSGSAAAVAAGSALWALGSDTGGSVREPAAFCGIVGLKPTYGRISRYGLVAFASSLDQIGTLTRSVPDAALLLSAMWGPDPYDATSAPNPAKALMPELTGDVRGLRIGIISEHVGEGVDSRIRDLVMRAAETLRGLGAELVECSLPHSRYAVACYYLIAPAEASSNLARYDGIRYGFRADAEDLSELYGRTRSQGFGPEVKRRIMLGTYSLSSGYYEDYYLKAQKVRTLIGRDFEQAFQRCDVLLGPTCPNVAFCLGELVSDPLALYLMDVMTIPANLAGLPALSVPCGTVDGLPVGLQLHAPAFREDVLLRAAHAYEQTRGPCLPVDPVPGKEVLA